ncbi:MAG: autotransporter-associated beta strand repeat-containing protein, partial [Dechloromonas sp.]|nr:autotransporter-associated beta strand repeat-containing protein [Dechloromonas sp.]
STGGAANATISGNLALGGNRTFTTTNAADGLTVSAVISGANTLTKAGAGTLTLSGANTYTGTTTISAGTLVAGNASALGGTGSGTSVANGAALTVDNVALNAEPVTLQAGGTLRGNGNASLSGTVTQTGAATLGGTAGSTLTLNGTVNAGGFATAISGPGSVAAANAGNNFSTINIAGANNVSLRDANAITLGGGASTLTGNLVVQATGNITVTNTVTTTGGDITLAGANFVNSVGASALSASGRWLVYASTVTGNTFGGLLSGNQAIWGTSYPAAVSQLGNRYVFANSPTLTVTSVDRSKTYGQDGAPIVAGAFTVMGFVNAATYGNVFTQDTQANTVTGNAISAGSLTTANVGSYLIDVTPVTATTGYTLAKFNTGNLTVNPAPLTITGNSTTSQYTANAQANGYTVSGLLTGNGDSVTGVSTLASRTNVGTTNDNLTSATGTGLSNYTIGYVNGSLTITPAPLTITGNTTSSVYTAAAQTNGFTTAGLLGSDSVTSVATLASGTSVGTYADNLTSATGTGLSNYTIGYVNGGLTITPAPLTIKADNASRPVNTPNPPFTATYSGFVGGETPADVWGALQFSTPATVASPAGDYPITPFGQSSANYRITYVDGRLQVVGQPVTPPIIPPVPPLVTGERFDPQAVAATYMDAVPMVGQVPAVLYVSEQEGRSLLPDAASIRVVGGGLNVSR